MKHRLIFIVVTFVFFFLELCYTQSTTNQSTSDTSLVKAIPASEIARSSAEVILKLNDIQNILEPDPAVLKIDSLFAEFLKEFGQAKKYLDAIPLIQVSLRKLNNFQNEWLVHQSRLDQWQGILVSRVKLFESQAQELTQIQATWNLTREISNKESYSEAVKDQIKVLLAEIKKVDTILKERQDFVLTLQSKVSKESIIINDSVNQLTSAIEAAQGRLFQIDNPPFWQIFTADTQKLSIADQFTITKRKRTAILKEFFDNNFERILIHLSIFIILLILLFYLKSTIKEFYSKEKEQDQVLETSIHILNRPISTALIITLLITRLIYPHAPDDIYKLNSIIGLIPIIRILIGIIPNDMRISVYGLVLLYLIHRVYELPYEHVLIPRIILLILTVLTFFALIWLIRPKRPTIDQQWGGGWKWARFLARIGMVILVISLLANIFGFVGLSSFLTSAFLKSVYIAVAFLTAIIVLNGLFVILLRARPLQTLHMVRVQKDVLTKSFKRIITIAAYIIWFLWTLSNFNLYEPIVGGMLSILAQQWSIESFSISLGDILAFAVAIWLSLKISKFIRFILDEDVLPRIKLPRGVPGSILMLVHYLILAFGFIIAMAAAGIDWTRFAIIAGALGVGIGFGLQNVVNNFVSGLVLIFERPIKVGDTIEVGSLIGDVKRIGIRSSTVRTFTGAEIIVPNGNLISNEVVNWTLSDRRRRIDIAIGVAYGTDPKRVVKILKDLADKNEEVLNKPEPLVLFQGFGDSSLDFELRFWTANFTTWLNLKSEMTIRVEEAIKKAKIEIPFPQRDLHVRSVDPEVIDAGKGKQD